MKFDDEQGIRITDEIRRIINQSIENAGSLNRLAKIIGIPPSAIHNWQGNGERKGEYILWSAWKPLRDYMLAHGIIQENPQWMTPSERLERIQSLTGDCKAKNQEAENMKINEEMGMPITQEIKELIETAIAMEGNRLQLAKKIGIQNQTIYNWQGKSTRVGEIISWNQLPPFRDYLASRGLIDADDPDWMTPSELRERVRSLSWAAEPPRDEAELLRLYRLLNARGKSRLKRDAEAYACDEDFAKSAPAERPEV